MSSSSLLDIARFREINSELFENGGKTSKEKEKSADVFKRKLRRLMNLLVKYEAEEHEANQKDIQTMIHLLREVIPHMQKQERTHLEKVYKHLGTEKDK